MVRILYGVAGEGMGHAVRTLPLLAHLASCGHEIVVVAGGRAAAYLRRHGSEVREVAYLPVEYRDGAVHDTLTALTNISRLPSYVRSLVQLSRFFREFRPDGVVTDFELFTSYVAAFRGVPLLSVGNHQSLTRAEVDVPVSHLMDAWKTRAVTRLMTPFASRFVVASLRKDVPVVPGTALVDPPLREDVLALRPGSGKHVLVYQTSSSDARLLDTLRRVDASFVVYGYPRQGKDRNLLFRRFNERRFFADLASARAVITNGGFSLTSEAVFLGKPLLVQPVRKQYEQVHNARDVARLGFGRFEPVLTPDIVSSFISDLGKYRAALSAYRHDRNVGILAELDRFTASLQ